MNETTANAPVRPYSPLTLYVEGLELAGKSTLCRLLRDRLQAEYRHCAFLPDNPIYDCGSALHVGRKVRSDTLGGIFLGSVMRDLERYAPPDHHDLPKDMLVRDAPEKFGRMQDIMIETAVDWFGAEIVDTSNMEQEGEKERLVEYLVSKLPSAEK